MAWQVPLQVMAFDMIAEDPPQDSNLNGSARDSDERALRQMVEARRLAWNEQDIQSYRALLAPHARLTSATGKTAVGREDILRLYAEQRLGPYREACLPVTRVTRITFPSQEDAWAEAEFVLTGVRNAGGTMLGPVSGVNRYHFVRQAGTWLITSMIGLPRQSISDEQEAGETPLK